MMGGVPGLCLPPKSLFRGEEGNRDSPTAEEGCAFTTGGWHVLELVHEGQHKDPRGRGLTVPFTSNAAFECLDLLMIGWQVLE